MEESKAVSKSEQMTIAKIEGTLTAFSHTFMVGHVTFWLMELHNKGSVYHIMVRHTFQLPWRKSLQMYHRYSITDLKSQVLCTEKMQTYVARSTSILKELKENNMQKDLQGSSMIGGLKSYTGTVTKAIDEELGLWELDHKICLVMTFLCHVTGEIWDKDHIDNIEGLDSNPAAVATQNYQKICTNEYLKVGDQISIYHVHHSVIEGRIYLTCCGRSSLKNDQNRVPKLKKKISRCENSILDVIHLYGFSLLGLQWLLSIKTHLVKVLCPKFAAEKEVVKTKVGVRSFILKLIEEAWKRGLQKVASRSIFKEFLLHDHCIIPQKLTPSFSLVKIQDILDSFVDDPEEYMKADTAPGMWKFCITQMKQPSFVVGNLSFGNNGILRLHDVNHNIDILILGPQACLLEGSLVALYNVSLVVETFCIRDKRDNYTKLYKKYIIVDTPNMIVLKACPKPIGHQSHENTNITILSKSSVICSQSTFQHNSIEKFFIVKAVINQSLPCGQIEKWNTFIRFSGSLALANSCFEDGHSYTLYTGLKDPAVYLKKTFTNVWLRSMACHYGTSECVYIPNGTKVINMTQGQPCSNLINIKTILDGNHKDNELVTVTGIVKNRQLMSPKFDSEISSLPLRFSNDFHVGIPGSKNLRILVSDCVDTNCAVWLYFKGPQNQYIPQYPLGILPGVKIVASCVLRKISKATKNVYLQCSNFSVISPLSLPPPSSCKVPHHYLQEVSQLEGTFQVIAQVVCIQKVILKSICTACQSEIINGNCTYVGCQSPEGGSLSAYAEIVIDDGSDSASVFMKSPKHIQLLLELCDGEYEPLCSEVIKGRTLYFNRSQYSSGNSSHDEAFAVLCSHEIHCRPLRLECKKTSSNNPEEVVRLFCLNAFELVPEKDVNIWEAKINA